MYVSKAMYRVNDAMKLRLVIFEQVPHTLSEGNRLMAHLISY